LHATLTVERGTGYAEVPPDAGGATGVLYVASLFTPIHRAQYAVEHARIGPITTYARLVLEIETDGTLTPDSALHRAAAGLVDHFARVAAAIGTGCTLLAAATPVAASDAHRPTPAGDTPLDALGLSPRAYNALRRAGLTTVGNVLAHPTDDLSHVRNVGRHSAAELRDALVWTCSRTGSVLGKIFFGTNTRRKQDSSSIKAGPVIFTRPMTDATLRF